MVRMDGRGGGRDGRDSRAEAAGHRWNERWETVVLVVEVEVVLRRQSLTGGVGDRGSHQETDAGDVDEVRYSLTHERAHGRGWGYDGKMGERRKMSHFSFSQGKKSE